MSEFFYSNRFEKNVWLTNHAIEAMVKRNIILPEIKTLIESGEYRKNTDSHGWIYFDFPKRVDLSLRTVKFSRKTVKNRRAI